MVTFGQFFRQRRQALGLSLREFCRRHGFDPGNLSRLERSLVSPPQDSDVLASYARALGLSQDSSDWNTFFELAALETGRIPPQWQNSPVVQKTFRRLQGQRRRHRPWVSEGNFITWADFLDARSILPQLVRRLVQATVDSPRRVDFPAGEGIQRPGWDGIVETVHGNAYVPPGISVWEMGVSRNPRQKAEEDFKKRVKDPRGLDTRQVSFIFVTPRKWPDKDKWCTEKNKRGIWKEVGVYDATNLEQWLEIAPAVDAWFARLLGCLPEGADVMDIDAHWANLTVLTEPHLKPEVFLTSREQEIDRLQAWLEEPPRPLAYEARSPAEVIDFVAAYLASLPDAKRDEIAARILVVNTREAWQALAATRDRLVLIPHPTLAVEAEMVAEAVRQGHHVLLCSHRYATGRGDDTPSLPPVSRYDLEPALVASGFGEEEANRLARASGGSLTILKRLATRFPSTDYPVWSQESSLVPLLLAGNWDETYEGDRAVLAQLAGRPYADVPAVAHHWLTKNDPPVMHLLTHWSLVSREDSWFLLAPKITSHQLDTFAEVALEVLGEDDPKYDLPPDERWYAAWRGKRPKYSDQLRTGVAETLALLGARPDSILDAVAPTRLAERAVQQLLSNRVSWKRWASLSHQLPLLAEAAPEAFLDAVDKATRRSGHNFIELFRQKGEPLFSPPLYAGMLWALETLAWDPSWLPRTSLVLARLAQLDTNPEGKWQNRPIDSLREIFLPWMPHTMASVERRIKVLNMLLKRLPDVGWQLLLLLLHIRRAVSTQTHRPSWHDWALNWSRGVTMADYWQQVEASANLLLANVGNDPDRWEQLLKAFEHLPQTTQQHCLADLQVLVTKTLTTDNRQRIADTIRRKVQKHRYFSDANWVLPNDTVDTLEAILEQCVPQDLLARYAWLFGHSPRLPQETRHQSREEREEEISRARHEALEHIMRTGGLPKVLELAEKEAVLPHVVGSVLGKATLLDSDVEILPSLLSSDNKKLANFAAGYARERFNNAGWSWIEQLGLSEWTAEEAGYFAVEALPFERRTWELVAQLGSNVHEYYWSHVNGFLCDNKEGVEYAATKFLEHHRPFHAARVLDGALHHQCEIDPELLMKTLEAGRSVPLEAEPYEVLDLIQHLQKQLSLSGPDNAVQRLESAEWYYLSLLEEHEVSPKTLHAKLQRNPSFFAELLSVIYRPRHESEEEVAPPTEAQKARAQNAYRLLGSWESIPGKREDGTIDDQELMAWITTARQLCAEDGRSEVCDRQIGEILAHAPEESDGSWPCIPVRDVLDEIETDELVSGFEIGIFDKRGAYSKSLGEGGAQERELARKYAAYADACDIDWPRTAATLRRVARQYEADARREDERAQALL